MRSISSQDDMAASLDSSVWLNAVNGIRAEVDGVSIANVGLPGFADLPDESQASLGVGDGKTSTPRGLHFIADRCAASRERRRNSRSTAQPAIWRLVLADGRELPPALVWSALLSLLLAWLPVCEWRLVRRSPAPALRGYSERAGQRMRNRRMPHHANKRHARGSIPSHRTTWPERM